MRGRLEAGSWRLEAIRGIILCEAIIGDGSPPHTFLIFMFLWERRPAAIFGAGDLSPKRRRRLFHCGSGFPAAMLDS
jgi:hypothetical protein